MKLWAGHYVGKKNEWFLVWANTKNEALIHVDCDKDEPDGESLISINRPGMIELVPDKFESEYPEDHPDGIWYLTTKKGAHAGLYRSGKMGVEDWVEKCVKKVTSKGRKR